MIKDLKRSHLIASFSLAIILWANANAFAGQSFTHVGETAELFRKWHKVNDAYQLALSSPVYREQETDQHSRGYAVEKTLDLKGNLVREIYDYPKYQSPINIYEQVSASLVSNGYERLYECLNGDCGEAEGWQLYLSPLVGNELEERYYIAAKKSNIQNGMDEYLAIYISEIDGQPRTLVDIITTPTNHRFDVVVETQDMQRTIEKDGRVVIKGINFSLDSYEIPEGSLPALKLMADLINKNKDMKFVVVGHTDRSGSLEYNVALSQKRAEAVKEILTKKFNVNKGSVSAQGVGELSPMVSNYDTKGRALNRRVELVRIQ